MNNHRERCTHPSRARRRGTDKRDEKERVDKKPDTERQGTHRGRTTNECVQTPGKQASERPKITDSWIRPCSWFISLLELSWVLVNRCVLAWQWARGDAWWWFCLSVAGLLVEGEEVRVAWSERDWVLLLSLLVPLSLLLLVWMRLVRTDCCCCEATVSQLFFS